MKLFEAVFIKYSKFSSYTDNYNLMLQFRPQFGLLRQLTLNHFLLNLNFSKPSIVIPDPLSKRRTQFPPNTYIFATRKATGQFIIFKKGNPHPFHCFLFNYRDSLCNREIKRGDYFGISEKKRLRREGGNLHYFVTIQVTTPLLIALCRRMDKVDFHAVTAS